MQSGISASEELKAAFKSLVSDSSQRGIIAAITKEQITPTITLSATGSFEDDLSQLSSHITPNQAAYLILRRWPGADDGYVAITYVPDSAPVRQKMLFASTRLTLVRELGIERFRETIFTTTAAELSAEGFKKHDEHVKLQAPLTEEEQTLGEVKRLEAESGAGMSAKKSHVQGGVGFPIAPEAVNALKELNESDGGNLVQLYIDVPNETIKLVSLTDTAVESLSSEISHTEARYVFFKYKHTYGGQEQAPVVFIYTCPSTSKVNERMVYALSRRGIVAIAEKEANLTVEKKLEVSEPDELTADMINAEFHPKVETKKAFDRPKRPGRR